MNEYLFEMEKSSGPLGFCYKQVFLPY